MPSVKIPAGCMVACAENRSAFSAMTIHFLFIGFSLGQAGEAGCSLFQDIQQEISGG
jgi:hypothetical protein